MYLWFKKRYVEAILSGEKTSTIRMKRPRFDVGDIVTFHVGPKPAFAEVRILSVNEIKLSDLPDQRQASVRALYSQPDATLFNDPSDETAWQIEFQLV